MLCCMLLETSWITAVTVDEVLALPKGGSGFFHWRRSIQKQPPRTECYFQSEGMSLEGHAASGPNWPGVEWKYDR